MMRSFDIMSSVIHDFKIISAIKDTLITDKRAMIGRYQAAIITEEDMKMPFASTLIFIPCGTETYQIAFSQSTLDHYEQVFDQAVKSIAFVPAESEEERLLNLGEQESVDKDYSYLGQVLGEFDFRIKTDDLKNYEDGFIPWADITDSEADIQKLENKDKIVISQPRIKVIIDYPLTKAYEFTLTSNKGFSRSQLLREISKHYHLLYKEEENSATIKTIEPDKRTKLYNRNETNGKYGIWGHDIEDLVLSKISVYKNAKGGIIVIPDIES